MSFKKISSQKHCWKLLQFNENKRPPYWGTWRKKSLHIKPRKPFAYDKVQILLFIHINKSMFYFYNIELYFSLGNV